jgi:hypothetical protein
MGGRKIPLGLSLGTDTLVRWEDRGVLQVDVPPFAAQGHTVLEMPEEEQEIHQRVFIHLIVGQTHTQGTHHHSVTRRTQRTNLVERLHNQREARAISPFPEVQGVRGKDHRTTHRYQGTMVSRIRRRLFRAREGSIIRISRPRMITLGPRLVLPLLHHQVPISYGPHHRLRRSFP